MESRILLAYNFGSICLNRYVLAHAKANPLINAQDDIQFKMVVRAKRQISASA